VPVVYVNCVGGQDELVFDGGSLVVGADGEVIYRARQFRAERFCLDVPIGPPRTVDGRVRTVHARTGVRRSAEPPPPSAPQADEAAQVWGALVTGTRDFARRNGATSAVLGLSGGIDSAVTAAVAAEALGAANVLGLSMPAPGTPAEDLAGARRLAENLGIGFETIAMDAVMAALGGLLVPLLEGRPTGGTRNDLLARMRGAVLLAVSDELGHLALATGNKTELSIGSAALYGDMAGGFAPLKDCPKTLLYRLARHRNSLGGPAIPETTLARTPSALRDEDVALPAYEQLDEIVGRYVERAAGLEEIVAAGFDPTVVRGVLQLIDDAEPKRRQTPPGVKITARAFGKDRRMPITNAWRPFADESTELAGAAEWAR
jgi:NAD+ synthase (glutamine-hydrolysing)